MHKVGALGHEQVESKQTLAYTHGSETTASHRLSINALERLVKGGEGSNKFAFVYQNMVGGTTGT